MSPDPNFLGLYFILLLALVVGGIWFVRRHLKRSRSTSNPPNGAPGISN